jgi:hypothetical protein
VRDARTTYWLVGSGGHGRWRFRRHCPFGALPFVVLMTDGQPGLLRGCQA